jgi:hypothetical protein
MCDFYKRTLPPCQCVLTERYVTFTSSLQHCARWHRIYNNSSTLPSKIFCLCLSKNRDECMRKQDTYEKFKITLKPTNSDDFHCLVYLCI